MNSNLPHIDLLSFALGFGLASLFWLIVMRVNRLMPKMKQAMAVNQQKKDSQKNVSREHSIRLFILRKAQSSHLARALFPLDKVLIEPNVIAPPDCMPGFGDEEFGTSLEMILPYTPEVPELHTDFPMHRIPLEVMHETFPFICLCGDPGAGKTTALASLASRLAGEESKALPVLISAHDFSGSEEPAANLLAEFLAANVPGMTLPSLQEIVAQAASRSQLTVLIDDLDELDKADFDRVVERVGELQTTLPNIRILVTANTFYTGKLEELGFVVCALAPWSRDELNKFTRLWAEALLALNTSSSADHRILQRGRFDRVTLWLQQEQFSSLPLETTLKVWLSFFNGIQDPGPGKLLESYLLFVSDGHISIEGYKAIANSLPQEGSPFIPQERVPEILESSTEFLVRSGSENGEEQHSLSGKWTERDFSTKSAVALLATSGLFYLHPDGKIKFCNIKLVGYLRSISESSAPLPDVTRAAQFSGDYVNTLHKGYSEANPGEFIVWLSQDDQPLHRNYLIGLKWLAQLSWNNPLKPEFYKRVARLLQDRFIPFGLRTRLLFYLANTKDNSILSLLTILMGNRDPSLRKLTAFGLGFFVDDKAITGLSELSIDADPDVQKFALLSLGRIWTIPAQDAIINIIFNADENIRAYACEILQLHGVDGQEMLKEIIATDNYLARKAAISGLRLIDEPWVREMLEKISVEDTQWVVRDAAINALEHLSDSKALKPEKLLPVAENPWTLEMSEEFGIEVSSKTFPDALLLYVLDSGQDGDKRIALHYMMSAPTPDFIDRLNKISRNENSGIREDAINALFSLSRRGLEIR